MMIPAIILFVLLTSGCIMIDTELQVPDQNVKPILTGKDCVLIIFGFGFGTVRMGEAMKTEQYAERQSAFEKVRVAGPPLRRIHSIILKDEEILFFGHRCLEIKGEP